MIDSAVYCDGSCINNNSNGRRGGGIGIHFDNCHYSDISLTLDQLNDDEKPTNQRAELWAMIKSFQLILKHLNNDGNTRFTIYSDSSYVIQCILNHVPRWIEKFGDQYFDWYNSMGYPVANRYLIDKAYDLYHEIDNIYNNKFWGDFELRHVRGHSDSAGNDRADELARKAANRMLDDD